MSDFIKISTSRFLHRAWTTMRAVGPFRLLDAAERMRWLDAVMQIHEHSDDGETLHFRVPGLIHNLGEFAFSLDCTELELERLWRCNLLVLSEGARSIALPRLGTLRTAPKRSPTVPAHQSGTIHALHERLTPRQRAAMGPQGEAS